MRPEHIALRKHARFPRAGSAKGGARGGFLAALGANRFWLFGGVGVILVAAIVALIAARPSAPEPQEAPATAAPSPIPAVEAPVSTNAPLPTMVPAYELRTDYPNTIDPLGLPESSRVDDSYFDDAIFVGDSVTLKLRQYALNARKNGEPSANFLAAQSFSARNALHEVSETSIHPVIGGVKMTLEEAVAVSGAKKLYIMLGMNDVGVVGAEKSVQNMIELLRRIQEKNPGIRIFVESATPRLSGTEPTTGQLFEYDVKLYDAILALNDPNIRYVDVAYAMRDEQGKLRAEFCGDPDGMAIHFTNEGCRQWIDYLYTHALA